MMTASETISNELIIAKLCSIFILMATSITAGILPIKLGAILYKNSNKKKIVAFEKVMSFFLHFGAGVLLCTIFLHLMPDMREQIERTSKTKTPNLLPKFSLSFTDIVVCFGFFLIYSIEQIMHAHLVQEDTPVAQSSQNDNEFELSSATAAAANAKSVNVSEKGAAYKIVESGDFTPTGCAEHKHIRGGICDHKNYHSCESHQCPGAEHESHPAILGHHDVHRHHHHEHIPDFTNSISSGLLIVLALSLHEIFEGMTVGLEKKPAMVWFLLAAISCHKTVLAAFIGLQLLATKSKLIVSYIFITIYALASSVGIFIGLLVSLYSSENDYVDLVSVSLQGIATGTLLYVVFFEIYFKNESSCVLSGFLKAISSVSGFVFMAFLQAQLSHDTEKRPLDLHPFDLNEDVNISNSRDEGNSFLMIEKIGPDE